MTRLGEDGGAMITEPVFTGRRSKPAGKEAEVGGDGTIARCLGGDEIWLYNRAGTRRYSAVIAWTWKDGSAMVRLIDNRGEWGPLREVPATALVEWRKVRPK